MPTDFPNLIPHGVAAEVIESVADDRSGVMQLASVVRMPSGVQTMPVVTPDRGVSRYAFRTRRLLIL